MWWVVLLVSPQSMRVTNKSKVPTLSVQVLAYTWWCICTTLFEARQNQQYHAHGNKQHTCFECQWVFWHKRIQNWRGEGDHCGSAVTEQNLCKYCNCRWLSCVSITLTCRTLNQWALCKNLRGSGLYLKGVPKLHAQTVYIICLVRQVKFFL